MREGGLPGASSSLTPHRLTQFLLSLFLFFPPSFLFSPLVFFLVFPSSLIDLDPRPLPLPPLPPASFILACFSNSMRKCTRESTWENEIAMRFRELDITPGSTVWRPTGSFLPSGFSHRREPPWVLLELHQCSSSPHSVLSYRCICDWFISPNSRGRKGGSRGPDST